MSDRILNFKNVPFHLHEKLELFQWYGSAALPEYLKSHKKIEKYSPG
ncbi:MAG: hypothetical protein IPI90_05675 [Saprospiraceae bacterium]|nr:hypothetical protein [Candidatus Vicinibacter affinis]